ncbi:MAG: hypothetical protein ACXVDB_02255, partial [Tumebacillaceae bacterium]
MFSLLWGLLFRPRVTIEYIVSNPNVQQASQLNFLIVLFLMINTIFLVASNPSFDKLGSFKWGIAFLLPPFEFWLQRVLFLITSRLGLLMFAGSQMPRDPVEKRVKFALVRLAFPYVIFPMVFCSILSSAFGDGVIADFLYFLGLVSMFVVATYALKTIYGVSTAVAFWGPFLVQFLLSLVLGAIVVVIALIVAL